MAAATAKVRNFMDLNKNGTTETGRPSIGAVEGCYGGVDLRTEENSFALCNFPRTKAGGSECSTKELHL